TGSLNFARSGHTATLLNNGQVLIAGGYGAAGYFAELYNPATGTLTYAGSLNTPRYSHTATLLPNGMVLIAGGYGPGGALALAEMYNPTTRTFTYTHPMSEARYSHTATLLNNGMVLLSGGVLVIEEGIYPIIVPGADLYNPATGTFAFTGSLITPRWEHTATLLNNGMVLIAGGVNSSDAELPSAELYNPTTGNFTTTGSLNTARSGHTATLLNDGMVLMAGGEVSSSPYLTSSAELYNPASGTFTPTGSLNTARYFDRATLLTNGMVLMAGGVDDNEGDITPSAELYEPATLTPPNLVSIALSPANPTVPMGATQRMTATGTFSDSSTQQLASVTWSSSNPAAVSITDDMSNPGAAYSAALGSATVSACAGTVCGLTTVTAGPVALVSIAVTPVNPSITLGNMQQFTATGTYSDGSTQNLTSVASWSSSAPGVATITSGGLATGVALGTSTISATMSGMIGSTTLTVAPVLVSIAVTPANPSIIADNTQQFTATGTYGDGSTQNLTSTATWSSSAPSVATISNASSSHGLATAIGGGTTTIEAALGAINGSTTLTVTNPAPVLSGISPTSAALGGTAFTLTVSGSHFVPTSTVEWNGSALPTTFVSSSQLTATVPATDITSLGNSSVTVFNPTPAGGLSAAGTFTTYLGLPSNDLVYDAARNLLWASVPSSAGPALGNTVVPIDPYTGLVGTPIWVGSEPNKLALSNDDTMLWVSFSGTPSAGKVDLTAQAATPVKLYFPGGWGGNIYASSLAVVPGTPSSVAAAAGVVGIYDDAAERPNTGTIGATYLAFGANASTLYGFTSNLSLFTVDSTGIAASTTLGNTNMSSNDLRYDNGRLYLTSGGVLDGVSGNLVGTFNASGAVAPDSSLGRAFILNANPTGGTPNQISAFDQNTFVPVGSFPVAGVQSGTNSPSSLVRWGEDGLAFRTTQQIFILRNVLVKDLSSTPADLAASVSAPASSATGATIPITITVTNSGPSAATNVTLIDDFSANAIIVSAQPTQGSCGVSPGVRCSFGALANGAAATVALVVQAVAPGPLINTATVNATQPDLNTTNNSASSSTTITGTAYNPVPTLSSLSPQSALAGSPPLTLTVNGSNFSTGSTVLWNGMSLPTTFVGAGQLTATVDASLITSAGSADVSVSNSAPGGGVSGLLPFPIFQTVALDTNDIVFEPFTRQLFASVPSSASQVTGNSIVSIDPLTGTIGTPVSIGSEPTRLAVSDDGQYLYAVLSGSNSVRRMALATLTPGTQFLTVSAVFQTSFTASDLAVMPGHANVLATVGYSDGIQVWDVTSAGAKSRTLTGSLVNDVYEGSALAWGDPANLYSNDEGLSPSRFHRFIVANTSFAESDATYFDAVGGKISYSGGLVFSDGGGVVDPSPAPPTTPRLVARLGGGGGSSSADTSINRAFFLSGNSYGVTSRIISAFDAARFTPVGATELDGLTGDAFDLIRWGADGLAFRTAKDFWGNGSGRVVLLHGPSVLPRSPVANPVPAISALSPSDITAPAGNTWVTITGSNFVPGAVAQWGGADRTTVFVNSGQLSVAIPAADLATPNTVGLQVVNPTPGGGSSNVLDFTIN
ncbi:MAG: kelch repeat-containing protein, partial [Terriglobia bacterium]